MVGLEALAFETAGIPSHLLFAGLDERSLAYNLLVLKRWWRSTRPANEETISWTLARIKNATPHTPPLDLSVSDLGQRIFLTVCFFTTLVDQSNVIPSIRSFIATKKWVYRFLPAYRT